MAGLFQDTIGGGEGSRTTLSPVKNDSAVSALTYLGSQGLEANRGYHDAQTEAASEEIIRDRLANYAIQRGEGKDPELLALKQEFLKYKTAVDQGAMTNSQMQVRLDSARKRAVNAMPGREQEINALVQTVTGRYKGMIKNMHEWEVAQAKSGAAQAKKEAEYEKKFRTFLAEHTSVPYSEAWNPNVSIKELTNKYPEQILRGEAQLNGTRNLQYLEKIDNNNKRVARQEFGKVVTGMSSSLMNRALNIASSTTGRPVTDISLLSSQERAAVADALEMQVSGLKGQIVGGIVSKGYTEADADWENTVGQQTKNIVAYLKGEKEKDFYETENARILAVGQHKVLGLPGADVKIAAAESLKGLNMIIPGKLSMELEKVLMDGIELSQPDAGNAVMGDSGLVRNGVHFFKALANSELTPEAEKNMHNVLGNYRKYIGEIKDPQAIQDFVVAVSDPKLKGKLENSWEDVQQISDTVLQRMSGGLHLFLQSRGMQLKRKSDGTFTVIGGTSGDRSAFNTAFAKTLNGVARINAHGETPVFTNFIGLFNADQE